MDLVYEHFINGFEQAVAARNGTERRIGAELKFPLVNTDGSAVSFETVYALWDYLRERGWQPVKDAMTGKIVGVKKPGEQNDTVASCETGFCKTEFSFAHVTNLFDLDKSVRELREKLRPFSEEHRVRFLGYGIQPVTPPSKRLLMKKGRTSVWDKVFGSNRVLPPEDGDDVNIFTINAASHVHLSVSQEEAISAVNVLNGFAGAQIALTANSNIWKGQIDPQYKCVAEKFWDWWMPDAQRVGIPEKPFENLKDYVHTVARFRPVYVKRVRKPIVLTRYQTFEEYYHTGRAIGLDTKGREISFVPEKADIDLHSTCYWYNARISRYYTVENRVNDQQPPDDLICVAALTLGLVSALFEASEELSSYNWEDLRTARESACQSALEGRVGRIGLAALAGRMLSLAQLGLRRRGLGEEKFLAPLENHLREQKCPADDAAQLFESGGIDALLADRRL
jgi:gamma-glutamylcysteine synthetase